MRDLMGIMKQAQAMQQKLQDAQAELETLEVEGASGGGMVKVVLTGKGDMRRVAIDPSLMVAEEREVLEDLIVAAHADAKRKLDEAQQRMMQEAAGPLAGFGGGMPGFPKF